MIVDAFLEWSARAPKERRIEAADALARSYLHSKLSDEDRRKVVTGLFALLDDPHTAVRERLASVFADRRDAPPALVLRLVDDVPIVCRPLYARSPLLRSAHLIDGLLRDEPVIDQAIAKRIDLDVRVVGLLLEQAGVAACMTLVSNAYARLSENNLEDYIARFGADMDALQVLQAHRQLSPELQCLLVSACAQAYQANAFVRALVPDKRLERLTDAARERALLELMDRLDGQGCWRVVDALLPRGMVTPAFVLRAALSGQVPALEALVARLSDVSMDRVRTAFVHARPTVASTLLKKTKLSGDVRCILSMAFVLARELARADVPWTAGFFAETLLEVIDERCSDGPASGGGDTELNDATVALCHSISADIMQMEARQQTGRVRTPTPDSGDFVIQDDLELGLETAVIEALAA